MYIAHPGFQYHENKKREGKEQSQIHDKIFKQVVDAADIIPYVLDAQDPEGTRSREMERQIVGANGSEKRLILISNKIDLVPGTPERVVGLSPQILPNAATTGEQVFC